MQRTLINLVLGTLLFSEARRQCHQKPVKHVCPIPQSQPARQPDISPPKQYFALPSSTPEKTYTVIAPQSSALVAANDNQPEKLKPSNPEPTQSTSQPTTSALPTSTFKSFHSGFKAKASSVSSDAFQTHSYLFLSLPAFYYLL
ncbi:hypothetical protein DSO57_1001776 [Entomophthora muscae]|uniref:Uncharacterized protein n=1 Tax=Entomophthora muscae TaxID=34485 RepID=A0ACC2T961_9FUNG|nr:hypothetical protein DSO57_1001776 [Entomophthora muscae]